MKKLDETSVKVSFEFMQKGEFMQNSAIVR